MNVDRAVMAFAGMMILDSVLLAFYVSPYWLALTAIVGNAIGWANSDAPSNTPPPTVDRRAAAASRCVHA